MASQLERRLLLEQNSGLLRYSTCINVESCPAISRCVLIISASFNNSDWWLAL